MLTNAFMIAALALSAIVMIESIVLVILITKLAARTKAAGDTKLSAAAIILLAAFPTGLLAACVVMLIEAALLLYAIIYCIKKLKAPASLTKSKPEPKPRPKLEFKPEPNPEPKPLPEIEIHEAITAEEAHEAMDDTSAAALIEIHRIEPETVEAVESQEAKSYSRKEIINIDTLSSNFNPGDMVNLDTLKEKGLIPPKTDYIKVLARGTLDKHLTVEANEYSADAVKMIVLTGGKAIKDV